MTKVDRYVERARELRALEAQLAACQGEARDRWLARYALDLRDARVQTRIALSHLTGTELGRARVALGAVNHHPPTQETAQ
jgi:hypothetical protein